MMKNRVKEKVEEAFQELTGQGILPKIEIPSAHQVSVPKQRNHGDFASNISMLAASAARLAPRKIAKSLAETLHADPLFEKVEVAGPGFLNFFVARETWQKNLLLMYQAGERYGESDTGRGRRVLVEFVSANPTGPLHVGHGRGAAVGDSLARIMKAAGFRVETEYYINDVGNQMKTLGRSVYLRYLELLGEEIDFPGDHYQGEYIKEIAAEILESEGDKFRDVAEQEVLGFFTQQAVDRIFRGIKEDLQNFGVHFDNWFSERTLHESSQVEQALEELKEKGFLYEEDGALWFRTSQLGDEKDRVVRRSNGELTYFAADIAYHLNKIRRGYDMLVDIWGADHHGYVPRVKAAIRAFGKDENLLNVLLVQLVSLIEGGEQKAMSTRAGEFVTLREVLEDVGRDAARFIFLTRRCDSPLEFDLDLARSQTQENPVFYVQYAHARLASVFRKAKEAGVEMRGAEAVDVTRLSEPEEIDLLKAMDSLPLVIAESAEAQEPHRITYFLTELAGKLHKYYTKHRFLGEDEELTQARLLLASVLKQVFKKGLGVLGVSAPESM